MSTTMTTPRGAEHSRKELRPTIVLTAEDHARLSALARATSTRMPDVASALADELDRARVLAKGRHPEHIVCMGSEVEFRDDAGTVQTVTLVYPDEADIARRKISVLTPIGTALIGLRSGSSITWHTRSGAIRRLTVCQVRDPASS